MKVLLNTTKTMDLSASLGASLAAEVEMTTPIFYDQARELTGVIRSLGAADLAAAMGGLSDKLAAQTLADAFSWGQAGEQAVPALYGFTGLVYKYLDPKSWSGAQVRRAQGQLLILSGLYGVLRPLDSITAYRLEMGSKLVPPGAENLLKYWRTLVTAAVKATLDHGETIINLAAQEYTKVLAVPALESPIISPVFKERRPDGSLKTGGVYAKMARGALAKYIVTSGAKHPRDLLGFGEMAWEAATDVPETGDWLFTRAAKSWHPQCTYGTR